MRGASPGLPRNEALTPPSGGRAFGAEVLYPSTFSTFTRVVISIHTHKVERLRQTLGREGGLRTPMHMRHMQPHTHRRKPHTPEEKGDGGASSKGLAPATVSPTSASTTPGSGLRVPRDKVGKTVVIAESEWHLLLEECNDGGSFAGIG